MWSQGVLGMIHGATVRSGRLILAAAVALLVLSAPGLQVGAASPVQDSVIEVVDAEDPAQIASPSPAPSLSPSPSPSPDDGRQAFVDAVVRLTNAERARVDAPKLRPNDALMQAAQAYTAILAPGPCFEHTCQPVPRLRDRLENAGYVDWQEIGENIAAGDRTPEGVVANWMDSPGHRANILKREYQETGVGVLRGDGKYRIYWVQVFGTRWQ
jgi:uncharacterized protein YkwD